jgi:hypothetical protein
VIENEQQNEEFFGEKSEKENLSKMTTALTEDHETSIRVIMYKGDRDNCHQWKIKKKAIGMKNKWVQASEHTGTDCRCSFGGQNILN